MSKQEKNGNGKPTMMTQCVDVGDCKRVCVSFTIKEVAFCGGCPDCPPDQREHHPDCAWGNSQRAYSQAQGSQETPYPHERRLRIAPCWRHFNAQFELPDYLPRSCNGRECVAVSLPKSSSSTINQTLICLLNQQKQQYRALFKKIRGFHFIKEKILLHQVRHKKKGKNATLYSVLSHLQNSNKTSPLRNIQR